MKLCVIGNSHVGMLRAAVRLLEPDSPEITFFAKAGAGLENATLDGSVISARDPDLRRAQARFGMPEAVDTAAYDAVILVAGTASIYSALAILQDHRVSGWPSCAAHTDPDQSPQKALISEAAFTAALTDLARAGVSHRYAQALRQASDVPIFLVPQPYPSERVFDSDRPREFGFQRARRHGEGAAIAACLARAIDAAFAPIGGVTVLHQPPETVAHGFTTARAYTRDAVRVDGDTAQHAADLLHVGPAFGAQVLARVYAELEAFATA